MKPSGPKCQSCGMPMSMDRAGGGTNLDGSRSGDYCSHCFLNGTFTDTTQTVDGMIARVEQKLKEMKLPPFVVARAKSEIPLLRRWRG